MLISRGGDVPPTVCRSCRRPLDPEVERCLGCGALRRSAACDIHPTHVADRACVVCGVRLCARCRRGSRHAAVCVRHERLRLVQGWAEVLRTGDEGRAEVVAGTLRAGGIPAHVLSQKDHAYVFAFGGLAVVRVLVPAFRLERARALLENLRDPDGREARA